MQEDTILGIFCCPSPPCSLKNYVTGTACQAPYAEVAILSASCCRTPDTTTTSAASLYSNTLSEKGRAELTTLKTMGTPMFHRASQSFYTQEQVTSNLSWPVLRSPWYCLAHCWCVWLPKPIKPIYSRIKSRISLPDAIVSSEPNIPHPGFRRTHLHAYSCITHLFFKDAKISLGEQCSSKKI